MGRFDKGIAMTNPPEALRLEALRYPNGWVYEIDPRWDPDGEIPLEGIVRGWKVDERGLLTGEVWENPRYKPGKT
jgi:hypothetical protein